MRQGNPRPASVPSPPGVRALTPAARELMEVLWASPRACTGRTVHDSTAERFAQRRRRALSSTATLLQKLADAGYVEIDRTPGRRQRYRPLVTRSDGLCATAEHLVEEFCQEPADGLYLLRAFLRRFNLGELVPRSRPRTDAGSDEPPRRSSGR